MSYKTVQLIVELDQNIKSNALSYDFVKVKHALPMINALVVEVPEDRIHKLRGIKEIKSVHQNTYITAQMNAARKTVKADIAEKKGITGAGIGIAILDTGISPVQDFTQPRNRIAAFKDFVSNREEPYDDNGHGTHVSGISAGNGMSSQGKYTGIAPEAHLIGVKILDEAGRGDSGQALAGIQWILDHKKKYNIRIANLSIGTMETNGMDPLVKAVETAWEEGIVITIAAGNNGPNRCTVTSPGVSRKVITVGASDDNKEVKIWGNTLVNFSGRGPTKDCIVKPDLIAPGTDIISCLTKTPHFSREDENSPKCVDEFYMKLSGTSMATPIVTGSVALLLQKYPHLSPNDVKYRLKMSTDSLNYSPNQQGWGLINIEKLLREDIDV